MKKIALDGLVERIKEARGTRSQAEIARELGMNFQTWNSYETGKSEPQLSTVAGFCRLVGVSADWLLGLSDKITSAPASPCPSCAEKDAVIAQLSASLSGLTETVRTQARYLDDTNSSKSNRRGA